jgi:outer membrane protein assembly factor BamD
VSLNTVYRRAALITVILLAVSFAACSSPEKKLTEPAVEVTKARQLLEKKRYSPALEILEGLKFITAGTAIGGEVQYLTGKALYGSGKFEDAESHFSSYLAAFPEGPFAEDALYFRAQSNVKVVEKKTIGLLKIKKFIPHDRDVASLIQARNYFSMYLEKYPDADKADSARELIEILRTREGEYELSVASFYLKRGESHAALIRAQRILTANFPPEIKDKAKKIADRARSKGKGLPKDN